MTIHPQPSTIQINDHFRSNVLWLAEHHAQTVAEVEAAKQDQIDGNYASDALAQALANEAELRISLIRCQPSSIHEAQTKLLYLVHFLARSRSSFDTSTMSELENSIAHLLR